ncbi:hypothetical protein LGH70_18610 [Hymenobacter sp. BT635]|uniref:Uncharacterized protein n=1 Tax=Hymenobacter nitidus TaxID=2880929 RepID=A0ABS8AGP1_9BACT|nr:hypothetical protein [Hymenobacter nitidus]MCB2379615.1 hypothetical protein [Hymenobacter nitidus]
MNIVKTLTPVLLGPGLVFTCFNSPIRGNPFKQLANPVYSQALDSITRQYLNSAHPNNSVWKLHQALVKQLRKARIDTILYYQAGCVGCEDLPERSELGKPAGRCTCAEDEQTVYLFWQDAGKVFGKRLHCCRSFPVAKANPAVISFYFQNKQHFQRGEQFYRDFEAYNRSHPQAVKFLPPFAVHDDVEQVFFYLRKDTLHFQVRKYDFTSVGKPKYLPYQWK